MVDKSNRQWTLFAILASCNLDAPFQPIMKSAGENKIGAALTQGKNMLVGSKRTAPKALLALLDSEATDDLTKPAQELKESGIGALAIGGSGADQGQLKTIAGNPENVLTPTGFSNLPSVLGSTIGKVNNSEFLHLTRLFLVLLYLSIPF